MSEDLTPLKISPNVLADIYREARSAFPYECCGWLSGPKDGGEVTVVRACENAQALGTHPTEAQRGAETAYVITGKDLLSLNHTLESDTRIQVFDLEGQFLREWGSEGEGDGEFFGPSGIALDGEGNVYVADSENYPAKVIFHSHPNGRAYLSPTDREVATSPWGDGPAYPVQQLVVGIDGDRVVEAALFAWSDDEGGFVQIDRFDGADV